MANPGISNTYTIKIVIILMGIIMLKFIPILLNQYNRKKLKINFWITFFIINTPNNIYEFKCIYYSISFLSVKALSRVIESIYSISAPIGIPLAIRVTFMSNPSNIFLI